MASTTEPRFTDEFKREAVALSGTSRRLQNVVAGGEKLIGRFALSAAGQRGSIDQSVIMEADVNLKREVWKATKADGLVAAMINAQVGGGASYNKFRMRRFRLSQAQTPNGARVRSCLGIAGFDAEVGQLGNLITAIANQQFVVGGDIRWMVDALDSAHAMHGSPDLHFILKEDGSRVKEFVITYSAGGLHGSENIVAAYTQAHSTSQFVQTT